MTKDEIKQLIAAKIAGQGSAIDAASVLPAILEGIIDLIPEEYSLPVASAETLGGVKVGKSLFINANGVLDRKSQILYVDSLATFADYTAEQAAQSMGISVEQLSRLFVDHDYCAISDGINLYQISIVGGGDNIYLYSGNGVEWGASYYLIVSNDKYTLNEV